MAKNNEFNPAELPEGAIPPAPAEDTQSVEAAQGPNSAPQSEGAPSDGPAPEEKPSKRDEFRSRIAEDYPDLDIDDEDAYYDAANERYDELKNFRTNTQNFRDALDLDAEERGTFNEMIVAASKQKDFDPVIWLVERGGLDIDALQNDPDYARKLADARKKYLDQVAEGDKITKEFEENAPKSLEEISQYCADNNIDDDTKTQAIGQMYDMIDSLMVGKMPVELFELVVKGLSHDEDVDYAREAGKAEGRQAKIGDKVRKIKKSDRVSPTQQSTPTSETPSGENMFGL